MKILISLLLILLAQSALAAEPVTLSSSEIADGLYLLQGKGGNVLASVGDDGVLLIDDDYADLAPLYKAKLAELGSKLPRFLINTHWHGDHVGGNNFWGASGATIVAHENVRKRVSSDQHNALFGRTTPALPRAGWPVVTFSDSMALNFNNDTLELQHFPAGHTDGDVVVFFVGSNVVHMGDHFFKNRFPFVDLASGGSAEGYLNNVESILLRVDAQTVIVPGHGGLANYADLLRYQQMLVETRAEMVQMKNEGLSLKAMQARGLDRKWQSWGAGFVKQDNYISFVAAGL